MTVRRLFLWVPMALLLTGACAALAYLDLFSTFMPYDDEGVIMLSNRLFLSGYTPYTEISWLYGPAHIAQVQFLHDGLGVPISHSAVRYITLLNWMLLCAVAGLLLSWLTCSRVWGLVGFVLSFLYTGSTVNEPGHPQVWMAAVGLLIPWCLALPGTSRRWIAWFLVGCVTAVVFHTKINAGVFCVGAVVVALLAQWAANGRSTLLAGFLTLGSLCFPFLLMAPLLAMDNSVGFALICGSSMAAVALVAVARPVRGLDFYASAGGCFAGFALVTVVALLYAGWHGIGALDIVAGLRAYATEQQAFYHFFRDYSAVQLGLAVLALGCAGLQLLAPRATVTRFSLLPARVYFVAAALYSLTIDDAGHSQSLLGNAGAWCWLVIVGPARGQGLQSGRLLLAALAAWSPLLAYPIPGTQLYMGSLPILLAALVCMVDGLSQLGYACDPGQARKLIAAAGLMILLVAVGGLGWQLQSARRHYAELEPLALPGTGPLRIEAHRAGLYRELVAEANRHDVLLTAFRFNSLYLWSSAEIPGPAYLSQSRLLQAAPEVQAHIRATLRQADNPLVISRRGLEPPPGAEAPESWLQRDFKVYRRIGPYLLMSRRQIHDKN